MPVMRAALCRLAALALLAGACARPEVTPTPAPIAAPTAAPTFTYLPPTLTPLPTASPGPTATTASLFTPVTEADWQIGPESAAVTLLAYSDFECLYCASVAELLGQLRDEFSPDVRLVFRHYPLPQHTNAQVAAAAAEAAGAQGQFWEMHDGLFAAQGEWVEQDPGALRGVLERLVEELSLEGAQFWEDLEAPETAERVTRAYETARDIPLPGAPFLLFNGEPMQDEGLINHYALSTLIRLELLKARQFDEPPPEVIDPFRTYEASIETEKGEIAMELYAERAPLTVNNFVFLARSGWYDGVTFHRVITGFAAQTGDPSGTGYGGPGYLIPDEIVPDLRFDAAGWVGMANAGPDTNGSQFFITLAPRPEFDGRYTLFGRVTRGMAVVESLTPRDPNVEAEAPPGDRIITIRIEEK
jgi:cyclophilin family peptidyl-prolyl cis-trans isomerase/protein-disulfide isomerase